jgi:hypothetical protein
MSDVKNAVRALRKSPGFSIVAVLTIAVGIGANTALFSVYDRLVLNPVTIPAPASLVAIWVNNLQLNFNAPAVSWPRYEEIRSQNRSFASVGISAFDNFTLTGRTDADPATLQSAIRTAVAAVTEINRSRSLRRSRPTSPRASARSASSRR